MSFLAPSSAPASAGSRRGGCGKSGGNTKRHEGASSPDYSLAFSSHYNAAVRIQPATGAKAKRLAALLRSKGASPSYRRAGRRVADAQLLGSLELAGVRSSWEEVRSSRLSATVRIEFRPFAARRLPCRRTRL